MKHPLTTSFPAIHNQVLYKHSQQNTSESKLNKVEEQPLIVVQGVDQNVPSQNVTGSQFQNHTLALTLNNTVASNFKEPIQYFQNISTRNESFTKDVYSMVNPEPHRAPQVNQTPISNSIRPNKLNQANGYAFLQKQLEEFLINSSNKTAVDNGKEFESHPRNQPSERKVFHVSFKMIELK